MTEQLLNGANVVTVFEQVGRERMPQGMARCPFRQPRLEHSLAHCTLQNRLVQMMSAAAACRHIYVRPGRERGLESREAVHAGQVIRQAP